MKKLLLALGALLLVYPATAQVVPAPPGTVAMVCANNTSIPTPTSGKFFYVQCDANGKLITSGSSGGLSPSGTFNAGDIVIVGSATTAKDSLFYGTNGGISLSGGGIPIYNNCYWNDTDACTTENIRARERVFIGNAVGLTDNSLTCCGAASIWINSAPSVPTYLMRDPQLVVSSDRGVGAISGVTRVSDQTVSGKSAIGVSGYAWNNSPASGTSLTAWGFYGQCDHQPAIATGTACYGGEFDTFNFATNQSGDPYGAGFGTFDLWLTAQGTNPSNAAIVTNSGGQTFNTGINFTNGSLTKDGSGNSTAIALGSGAMLEWFSTAATPAGIISSNAAGTIRFGALDAAAPVAQTLQLQSVVAGTSNTSGADFTLAASKGTGTGNSGGILIQTSAPGSTGTAQNSLINTVGFRVGRTIVGSSTSQVSVGPSSVIPIMEIKNNNGASSANGLGIFSYQNSQTAPAEIFLAQSNSNAINTNAAVTSGAALGAIYFDGADGTNLPVAASIQVQATGTISSGIVPGVMIFSTQAATGANTLVEAFRIDSTQQIQMASAGIAANGAVATLLGSLGPTGAHTTVQEWFQIKGTGGAIRYVPGF